MMVTQDECESKIWRPLACAGVVVLLSATAATGQNLIQATRIEGQNIVNAGPLGPVAGGNDPGKLDYSIPRDEDGSPSRTLYDLGSFRRPAPGASPDMDRDGALTIVDVVLFMERYDAADLSADFTGDGEVDFLDFLAFFDRFDRGE